jgi:hypothetical protein
MHIQFIIEEDAGWEMWRICADDDPHDTPPVVQHIQQQLCKAESKRQKKHERSTNESNHVDTPHARGVSGVRRVSQFLNLLILYSS